MILWKATRNALHPSSNLVTPRPPPAASSPELDAASSSSSSSPERPPSSLSSVAVVMTVAAGWALPLLLLLLSAFLFLVVVVVGVVVAGTLLEELEELGAGLVGAAADGLIGARELLLLALGWPLALAGARRGGGRRSRDSLGPAAAMGGGAAGFS